MPVFSIEKLHKLEKSCKYVLFFLNFSFTNCIDIDNLSYEALNMVQSYMLPSLLCQMAQTNERALYLVAHLLRWTITPSTMETHHAYLLA